MFQHTSRPPQTRCSARSAPSTPPPSGRADTGAEEASDGELAGLVQVLPHGDLRRDRACEALLARYGRIVRSAVHRYHAPPDLTEDLVQVGYLGLMKAIVNFDPAVGDSLPAYATPCVEGEIKRFFRDRRWHVRVARQAQELRLDLRRAAEELTQELARRPSDAELASHLEISPGEVARARLAGQAFSASSLDAPLAEEGSATLADLLGQDDPGLELTLNMEALRTHWEDLPKADQQLLLMRFYGNMTQAQIGERLGISQMQVSRLLRRALEYLREQIAGPALGPVQAAGAGSGQAAAS